MLQRTRVLCPALIWWFKIPVIPVPGYMDICAGKTLRYKQNLKRKKLTNVNPTKYLFLSLYMIFRHQRNHIKRTRLSFYMLTVGSTGPCRDCPRTAEPLGSDFRGY